MSTLNVGILAHVDAGKTTLTERLLHAAGVIDEIGRVDDGTTQTDSLDLERQRGITIKSAVVSFVLNGVTINLIDTPGHPDFIAEVERVLGVLDGAVLVISAVEGVQPQTRILFRALRRLGIPTLLFVNKIDRRGADADRVLREIADRLTPRIVAMGSVREIGTRAATFLPAGAVLADELRDVLTRHDDALLATYLADETALNRDRLLRELAAQTAGAQVHPVYFGSAMTGAGLDGLIGGITRLLPAAQPAGDGPVVGAVFKVDRGAAGEKVAYVRVSSGSIHTRDRLVFDAERSGKVTAIRVFENGGTVARPTVRAGQVARLWGLDAVRVGDRVGTHRAHPRSTTSHRRRFRRSSSRNGAPTTPGSITHSRNSPSRTR